MKNLSNIIEELRKISMFNNAINMPALLEDAIKKLKIEQEHGTEKPSNIVIAGMGGSGIVGDLILDLLAEKASIPITVWKDYGLPGWVNPKTLTIVISYSGNTEETISALIKAIKRGSRALTITSNGIMLKLAIKYEIPFIKVPSGFQPREALPYLLTAGLIALKWAGIINENELSMGIEEAIRVLESLKEHYTSYTYDLIDLAKSLIGSSIVIYSYHPLRSAAMRFKQQLNENSKCFSKVEIIPEAGHNEIVGWKAKREALKKLKAIFIRDKFEREVIRARIEAFKKTISSRGIETYDIMARGEGLLARILSVIYITDLLSLIIAYLKGVDPIKIEPIKRLKELVKKTGYLKKMLQEL